MKCTKTLATIVFLFCVNLSSAQRFIHDIGAGIQFKGPLIRTTETPPPSSGSPTPHYTGTRLMSAGIMYFPKLVLLKKKNSSVTVGLPLTAGISWPPAHPTTYSVASMFSSSSFFLPGGVYTVPKKSHFAFDIPLVLDWNMGAGAFTGSKDKAGFYAGAGYAYMNAGYNTFFSSYRYSKMEPYFHSGIRLGAKQVFSIGLSYRWSKQFGMQLWKNI